MPRDDWRKLEPLFAAAVEIPPDRRGAFLAQACGGDQGLRRELESLLAAHEAPAGILDAPPLAGAWPGASRLGAASPEAPGRLAAGTRLGAWRLGELVGRGGAGEVYAATRADGAFEQQVAIKVLRREAGDDLERFHDERRTLAGLEHPGIARLLDGGVTADGRPYTVLELVAGHPLTEHCRARAASLDERLRLFAQVCDAVSYAHRHLVVHRDLKPGNILVSEDGAVKLLDFGIAKRLGERPGGAPGDLTPLPLTEAPLTLDYAAPEQLTGEAVTTATDVYALGVVLFELLTGTRPWAASELPVARVVRVVLDQAPPAASAAARRRELGAEAAPVPPRRLVGDLDAIVARCLRKPPGDRYQTVEALAQDLERHQRRQPVAAREGARLYLLGRFLSRHRWPVASGAALFLSLAAGVVGFAWQAERAAVERDHARRAASREEAVRYHLTGLFRASLAESSGAAGGEPITAKSMLDRSAERVIEQYRDDPQLAGKVVETLADLYGALGDVEGQVPLLEGFLAAAGPEADPRAVAMARQKLAQLELARGRSERAAELLAQAEAVWSQAAGRYREERLEGLFVRGLLERARGDLEGSIATYRQAIEERTSLAGRAHRETANLYNSLAITLTAANRLDEALAAHREALAILGELGRDEDLDALVMLGNTGTLAMRNGRLREAREILGTAWRKQRQAAGDSAAVAAAMGLYGAALSLGGDTAGARSLLDEAVAMAERFSGPASPLSVQNRLFRAEALSAAGELGPARSALDANLGLCRERYGEQHVLTLRLRLALARLDLEADQPARAAQAAEAMLPSLARLQGPSAAFLAHAQVTLGEALLRLGRADEALAPLTAAVERRESMLWSGSWELAEARARLGEARLATGDPRGAALLEQAAGPLAHELGIDHPQTRRARRALGTAPPTG